MLDTLPSGDSESGRGKRVKALVLGVATILKVEKWVRKVDLLETESSASTKQNILRRFAELKDLAQGKGPSVS